MASLPAAVTKAQVTQDVSARIMDWMVKAIPIINEKLNDFVPGTYRNIYESELHIKNLPTEIRQRAINELIAYYKPGGWTVTWHWGDQLDPDGFFSFS